MDPSILIAGAAAAAAVFVATLTLQRNASASRELIQSRISSDGSPNVAQPRLQLAIPRLASLSQRGQRLARDLDRAGVALTVSEYMVVRTAVAVVGALVALLLASSLSESMAVKIGAVAFGFIFGYWLPGQYLNGRKARRLKRIEDELVEVMVSMAKSLRAGVGLTQALEYAGRDAPDPLGGELLRVVRELQLGADVENVFEEMNARIASPDLEIASAAIIIQRRVGGNLSEVLTNVANTIRERKAIRNELNAITAKQRLQGNASALIPVFVAVFFFFVNHDTAKLLFTTTAGNIALAVGIFFEVLGLWMVRHFGAIEV